MWVWVSLSFASPALSSQGDPYLAFTLSPVRRPRELRGSGEELLAPHPRPQTLRPCCLSDICTPTGFPLHQEQDAGAPRGLQDLQGPPATPLHSPSGSHAPPTLAASPFPTTLRSFLSWGLGPTVFLPGNQFPQISRGQHLLFIQVSAKPSPSQRGPP